MNNYFPVNSSTQFAGEFPCKTYLYVYTSCKTEMTEVAVRAGQLQPTNAQ